MPNHFHLLLQQIQTDGIQLYLKLIQESFAKYINLLLPRTGSAFQQAFKVVHIENEPQFIHTARYIHLNPVTSNIIKSVEDLHKFPFTSFPDYFSTKPRPFIHTDYLLSFFKSVEVFKQHTFDQADYQKTLHSLHIPGM